MTGPLGFGAMRLPMKGNEVDLEAVREMFDCFLAHGFTYFDTAKGYLDGLSEKAIKSCLTSVYPRESYQLTDKLTAGFFEKEEDIRPLLMTQLKTCGVSYFDYYLMHSQNARNYPKFKQCRAYEQAMQFKKEGLIRHWGISFHDTPELLDEILTDYPEVEIVQIQFNYADYEAPNVQSRAVYEVARKHGKPVIIMEPVKGGTLAKLPQNLGDQVRDRYDGSPASLAIRFAASFDGVAMVLSGMSEMSQVLDNISFMEDFKPLTDSEMKLAMDLSGQLATAAGIKCTACAYCVSGCPKNIPIPGLFACYNQKKMFPDWNSSYYYGVRTTGRGKASDCIRCGKCEQICPQKLPIREWMATVAETFEKEKDDED